MSDVQRKKIEQRCATLKEMVDHFAKQALAGDVRGMLATGVIISTQLEDVAKAVTGTEVA